MIPTVTKISSFKYKLVKCYRIQPRVFAMKHAIAITIEKHHELSLIFFNTVMWLMLSSKQQPLIKMKKILLSSYFNALSYSHPYLIVLTLLLLFVGYETLIRCVEAT